MSVNGGSLQCEGGKDTVAFKARIVLSGFPDKIRNGHQTTMEAHGKSVPITIKHIDERCDRRTGKKLQDNPAEIHTGDMAVVEIETPKPVCLAPVMVNRDLSKFTIKMELKGAMRTIAVGQVVKLL